MGESDDARRPGRAPVVRLLHLDAPTLHLLAAGDLAGAQARVPVELTAYLVEPVCRRTWVMRSHQVVRDPVSAGRVTGLVVDESLDRAVGRAGFHGSPDTSGMVEVGYAIDPAYRRRGYARAALRVMLERAAADPNVRVVRASVRPDNVASRDLVLAHGFVQVGKQWDDEDGLELGYEVPAGTRLRHS
jgi:RimJ/RimL family protein N-acetyltransferase